MESGSRARVANRFIDFYGKNGRVYGQNVSDFLASISMSPEFRSRVAMKGVCPSRHSLSSLSWTRANSSDLISLVMDSVQTPACYGQVLQQPLQQLMPDLPFEDTKDPDPVSNPWHVWGYGLLFVTLINLCAVLGIIFLPCIGRRMFRLLMAFMVPLGIGSLLSTALLVLLPESLQLMFVHEEVNKANSSLIDDHHHHHIFHSEHSGHAAWEDFLSEHPWYLWRCCTVFGGIYMFFIIERLLKELIRLKGGSGHHGHSHQLPPASGVSPGDSEATDLANFRTTEVKAEPTKVALDAKEDAESAETSADYGSVTVLTSEPKAGSCCGGGDGSSLPQRLAKVQPAAWMILLGDSLHNFIDGLSIGAAFTRSTLSGVSICLAVLCEELPHELGDFFILLSSGMSMPMALACNSLSACTCYLGFALGVLIGESGASVWVFAIAAGMFLYISLVDMLPEVNKTMEEPEAKQVGRAKIFLLQNLGLFTGFGVILVLAVYGGNIAV